MAVVAPAIPSQGNSVLGEVRGEVGPLRATLPGGQEVGLRQGGSPGMIPVESGNPRCGSVEVR